MTEPTRPTEDLPKATPCCHAHAKPAHGVSAQASGRTTPPAAANANKATRYTCPMHPEVVRDRPDVCPDCGMALEPVDGTLSEENPELDSMQRRLGPSIALSLPVLLLAMGPMLGFSSLPFWPSEQVSAWLQAVLASPVVVWAGAPFFQRAWTSLLNRRANMFTLIALGSGSAFLFSLLVLLFPAAFPRVHGELPLYFEAAAVITTLVILGQVLELRARQQTSSAIRKLLDLAPKLARRIEPSLEEHDIPLHLVRRGDLLRVRPGERIPTDGVVVEGTSHVDEAMVTGEPTPIEKTALASLIGGTLNQHGSLVMRAERVGEETFLAQIVRLVVTARQSRAQVQKLADQVSAYVVPVVVLVACVTAVAWGFFGPDPKLIHALSNSVSVLIIACPCALGLATPMSLMVGLGRGAEVGVLIKNAEALERLDKVDTLVVDKTGTLTEGKPSVVSVHSARAGDEDTWLSLALALESLSEHPLAQAVVNYAQARGLAKSPVTDFKAYVGQGVAGHVANSYVGLGNEALMQTLHVQGDADLEPTAHAMRRDGQTVLLLARDGVLVGLLGVRDRVKESARGAVQKLHRDRVRIVMATGDHPESAARISSELGIDEVFAALLPEQKLALVKRLQAEGHMVAVAGDGVNDAPALSAADVGIAMGSGSDIALESADVALLHGDLGGLEKARHLSRSTMRNIRQNLAFAFAYNLLGVPLAAGVLYPSFGLVLHPMLASLAMSLSSVSVIVNALRLRSLKL